MLDKLSLLIILKTLGCPSKFLTLIIQIPEEHLVQVTYGSDFSELLPSENSIYQDFVLAPMLFSIFLIRGWNWLQKSWLTRTLCTSACAKAATVRGFLTHTLLLLGRDDQITDDAVLITHGKSSSPAGNIFIVKATKNIFCWCYLTLATISV